MTVLTSRRRRGKMALSQRNRGGRAGNRTNTPSSELFCNIPSHITSEEAAQDVSSQDLLEHGTQGRNVRLGRMLRAQQSAGLNRRRAAALAMGAATIAVATRALPRSRAFPKFRTAKRALPRFPKVVGVPRQRTPIRGVRRGSKGGAFRFPRFADFPRRRRTTRRRNFSPGRAAGFFQPGEEGF